jgi:hypothetical protein
MPKMSKEAIAESVMAYAVENYEKGYDWIVECMTIADIVAEMDDAGCTTKAEIMKLYAMVTDVREDRFADARNSAF